MPEANAGRIRRADQDADYERFQVKRGVIEEREDGRREGFAPGSFEWWYFDFHLDDKAWIVVSFMTKPLDEPMGELQPMVAAKIRMPGEPFARGGECTFAQVSFVAQDALCDVRVGLNHCRDVGKGRYLVEFRRGDIDAQIELDALVPPARIGTGHLLFEQGGQDQYLGWLVAVPHGNVKARYWVDGKLHESTGTGYHDHNWGNRPMTGPIDHWYWGRAVVGDFVVIAANVTPMASHGTADHTDLILVEGGRTIALGHEGVTFDASAGVVDPNTHRPVSELTRYTFIDAGGNRYVASFAWKATVFWKMVGSAAYHRFQGLFTLEVTRGGQTSILGPRPTTWELMWFGDQPEASALDLYTKVLLEPKGL